MHAFRSVTTAPPIRRATAGAVLVGLAVLLVWGSWRPLARHGQSASNERTDSALYAAVIGRVGQGEPYYAALGTELRQRGYPTLSIFNWRPPTLVMLLARAPVASFALLLVLVGAVIFGTVRLFYRETPEIMVFALLLQLGAAASAFNPLAFVLHETWAGLCIAVSVLLYAFGRFTAASVVVIAGLFLRELVAPYVFACALIAIRHRRRAEVAVFVVGAIAWLSFYAWHATAARDAMIAGGSAHPPWIQFGGPRFALAAIGFGGWFYLLPPWTAAVAGSLLVASIWAPMAATHAKVGAFTYALFFMVVGQQFNQYWGLLVAPTWTIAYGLGALGVVRLARSAFRADRGLTSGERTVETMPAITHDHTTTEATSKRRE